MSMFSGAAGCPPSSLHALRRAEGREQSDKAAADPRGVLLLLPLVLCILYVTGMASGQGVAVAARSWRSSSRLIQLYFELLWGYDL